MPTNSRGQHETLPSDGEPPRTSLSVTDSSSLSSLPLLLPCRTCHASKWPRPSEGSASGTGYAGKVSRPLPSITDVSDDALARWLAEQGEPPYRVRQIRHSVARSPAADWSTLTDLPKALRTKLADAFRWSSVALEREIA